MRRKVAPCLALLALLALLAAAGPARAERAAIVVDVDTGQVLAQHEPNLRSFPASITKIMTAFVAFDAIEKGEIKLDDVIKVSQYAAEKTGSRLGLSEGMTLTVEEAILGILLPSGNDAAAALAQHIAGTEEAFAERMTATARRLGMSRTTYRNASGLPNPQHQTTARDQAVLAIAVLRDFPQHYRYFGRRAFTFKGRTVGSHNNIALSYPGGDGMKTGLTCGAGYTLVGSAIREGRRLVAVSLGHISGRVRDARVMQLLTDGFRRAEGTTTLEALAPKPGDADPPPNKEGLAAGCAGVDTSVLVAQGRYTGGVPGASGGARPSGWSVDLGPLPKPGQASSRAASVTSQLAAAMRKGTPMGVKLMRHGRVAYHALISRLDQGSALKICQSLRQKGGYCTTVSPQAMDAALKGAGRRG